jgi:SNF2 family DNA or RNA helicase
LSGGETETTNMDYGKVDVSTEIGMGDPVPSTARLYKHQMDSVLFGIQNHSFANLSEMGTGKTLSTLALIHQYFLKIDDFRTLVICPKSIIMSSWVDDCKTYFPGLTIIPVIGTKDKKIEAFQKDGDIYVTNYETMNQPFNWDQSDFNLIVCDEAVRLKNHRAKWTKKITSLSKRIPRRIILSGLITPNNLMEIYAPFNMIQPGIFGKSFWSFRSKYFSPDPFSYENREWLPKKGSEELITEKIKPFVIRHTKDECLDLPNKVHQIRKTEMTAKQKKYYMKMKRDAVLHLDDDSVAALTKATLIGKLAQISSGFIYNAEKSIFQFESSKLNELQSIIHGELATEQVLIFTNFKAETKLFKEKYPEESFIFGGQNDSEQTEMINDFKNGKNRLMFASVAAAKYGLTFVNCSHVIYFSLNYSLDDFAQSQDRIHRIGQTRNAHYIYLLNQGTVDLQIHNALMKKKKLNELIIELIEDTK